MRPVFQIGDDGWQRCDDDFSVSTITSKQKSTCLGDSMESLLCIDARITQMDRSILLRFFQSRGLATILDP